jgi:hypothetical protein
MPLDALEIYRRRCQVSEICEYLRDRLSDTDVSRPVSRTYQRLCEALVETSRAEQSLDQLQTILETKNSKGPDAA